MVSEKLREAARKLRKEAQKERTVKSAQTLEALAGLEKFKRFLLR